MLFKKRDGHKGKKVYGVVGTSGSVLTCCDSENIDRAIDMLDSNFPILVEMTVTRVFTRERQLKEIELDITP